MKKLFTLLLSCSFLSAVFSQATKADPRDAQGWWGAGLKVGLPKKWNLNADYQARFINNLKTYNGSYISIGADKQLTKVFSGIIDYRLALVNKGTYHRFSIGGEAGWKLVKTSLSVRTLLQNQQQDFDDATKPTDKSTYWRVRALAKHSLSKNVDIYAAIEPIMKIGGRYFVDNWRNTIGAKIKVAPKTKLDLFFIYRPDYAKSYNRYFSIFGASLDFTIKNGSKKKKK